MNKICKHVWIIGICRLNIFCYLLFDAWDLRNFRTQLVQDILYHFNVLLGHNTRGIISHTYFRHYVA
jgi:hypothetical protein